MADKGGGKRAGNNPPPNGPPPPGGGGNGPPGHDQLPDWMLPDGDLEVDIDMGGIQIPQQFLQAMMNPDMMAQLQAQFMHFLGYQEDDVGSDGDEDDSDDEVPHLRGPDDEEGDTGYDSVDTLDSDEPYVSCSSSDEDDEGAGNETDEPGYETHAGEVYYFQPDGEALAPTEPLPTEIWLRIFSYLSLFDTIDASTVCKRWLIDVWDAVKTVNVPHDYRKDHNNVYLRRCRSLREYTGSALHYPVPSELWPLLSRVTVHHYPTPARLQTLLVTSCDPEALTSLTVDIQYVPSSLLRRFESFKSLRELRIFIESTELSPREHRQVTTRLSHCVRKRWPTIFTEMEKLSVPTVVFRRKYLKPLQSYKKLSQFNFVDVVGVDEEDAPEGKGLRWVEYIIESATWPKFYDQICFNDMSLLHACCQMGGHTEASLEQLMRVIETTKIDINSTMHLNGSTPLMLACKNGYIPRVDYLIKSGANVNFCDTDGHTALLHSFLNPDVMKMLIENGATNEASDPPALQQMFISRSTNKMAYKVLIDSFPHLVNQKLTYDRKWATHWEFQDRNKHFIDKYPIHGLLSYDFFSTKQLAHDTLARTSPQVIAELAAMTPIECDNGSTPLHLLFSTINIDLQGFDQLILQSDWFAENLAGATPIDLLLSKRPKEDQSFFAKLAVQHPEKLTKESLSLLTIAATVNSSVLVTKMLAKLSPDQVNAAIKQGVKLIRPAISNKDVNLLAKLLTLDAEWNRGADVKREAIKVDLSQSTDQELKLVFTFDKSYTPGEVAVRGDMLKLLLLANASTETNGPLNQASLVCEAMLDPERAKLIPILLKYAPKDRLPRLLEVSLPYLHLGNLPTPLMLAAYLGLDDVVTSLLDAGADLNTECVGTDVMDFAAHLTRPAFLDKFPHFTVQFNPQRSIKVFQVLIAHSYPIARTDGGTGPFLNKLLGKIYVKSNNGDSSDLKKAAFYRHVVTAIVEKFTEHDVVSLEDTMLRLLTWMIQLCCPISAIHRYISVARAKFTKVHHQPNKSALNQQCKPLHTLAAVDWAMWDELTQSPSEPFGRWVSEVVNMIFDGQMGDCGCFSKDEPYTMAAARGNIPLLKSLYEHCDKSAFDPITAIYRASAHGQTETIDYLFTCWGADRFIHSISPSGTDCTTLLHQALSNSNEEQVKMLLRHGCDPSFPPQVAPLLAAKRHPYAHQTIYKLLAAADAKITRTFDLATKNKLVASRAKSFSRLKRTKDFQFALVLKSNLPAVVFSAPPPLPAASKAAPIPAASKRAAGSPAPKKVTWNIPTDIDWSKAFAPQPAAPQPAKPAQSAAAQPPQPEQNITVGPTQPPQQLSFLLPQQPNQQPEVIYAHYDPNNSLEELRWKEYQKRSK